MEQFGAASAAPAARVERLRMLREGYEDPDDFARLLSERAALRQELAADSSGLDTFSQAFKNAYEVFLVQVRRHDPDIMTRGEAGGPFHQYRQAYDAMSDLSRRVRTALEEDETAFKKARVLEKRERRKFVRIAFGILGAALLAALFSFYQRRLIATAVKDLTEQALRTAQAQPRAGPRPPAADEPGRVIGDNFQIEKLLGTGGMGVVYLATDLTLRRRVAIKRMRDELLQGGAESESFLNEARLVAALKHPNVVEILSIVKEPGLLYLVFEYVEGKSLREWIALQKQLPVPAVKSVLHQVAQALDYAHAQKIVHRDLKPANVMVDMKGAVKVMDFGIAHQAQMTLARVTHTDRAGTPAYMAPEQEQGSASRAADVYATGVCLYEMLTGRLPYNGPDFQGQKLAMRFTPPSALVPGLPPRIDAVTLKALAADPGGRFASAGELSQAFLAV